MASIEILIATMHQTDFSLIEKMNIQTDAIVVNQCDHYEYHEIKKSNIVIKWFDVAERGLSRSRNVALSKATADICLLVDDDEILKDGYGDIIINEFDNNPDAGLITFNLESIGKISKRYVNKERKRLYFYNIMRYGSARIAFKRLQVINRRILFAPNFGAGTDISSGEDSLFLHDCLVRGIHAYSSPSVIAMIDDGDGNSSWFKGYTEKYFIDLGSIFAAMSPKYANLWILQYVLRHKSAVSGMGMRKCFLLMIKGKNRFRNAK